MHKQTCGLVQRVKHEAVAPSKDGEHDGSVGQRKQNMDGALAGRPEQHVQHRHEVHKVAEVNEEVLELQPLVAAAGTACAQEVHAGAL